MQLSKPRQKQGELLDSTSVACNSSDSKAPQNEFPNPQEFDVWRQYASGVKDNVFKLKAEVKDRLLEAGLVVESDVEQNPLVVKSGWSANEAAGWLMTRIAPDAYHYLRSEATGRTHPYKQPDEFIPVKLRGSEITILPVRPFTGKEIFTEHLARTNRKSSRLAFGGHLSSFSR